MNTTKLTLGEAAKEAKCSKATLSKALKKGDISGYKKPDGSYAIDPAELMRWNGERSRKGSQNQTQTPKETPINTPQNSILEAELKARDREIARLEDHIESLSRVNERLLAAPQKAAEGDKYHLGWFDRLLGRKPL